MVSKIGFSRNYPLAPELEQLGKSRFLIYGVENSPNRVYLVGVLAGCLSLGGRFLGCGTALHAGLVARFLLEGLAGLPTDWDYASEFRYRDPQLREGTLALALSQSGETADTLAALRLARERGCRTGAICNVQGSTLSITITISTSGTAAEGTPVSAPVADLLSALD